MTEQAAEFQASQTSSATAGAKARESARAMARLCLTITGILLILLALVSSGVRLALPLAAHYKGALESRVSDYLRSPVDIGSLSLSWEGLGPLLRARQVSIIESADRQVTLDELLVDLNLAKTLLRGIPVINELSLVGATLEIDAGEQGEWQLHGVESVGGGALSPIDKLAGNTTEANAGLDVLAWLMTARKVGLLDTRVTFNDQRSNQRFAIEHLNVRAENVDGKHQFRLDLKLPEQLGGALEVGADLSGDARSLALLDGDVYLKADTLQVQALFELALSMGIGSSLAHVQPMVNTEMALELWGRWESGKLLSARGPLSTGRIAHGLTGERLAEQFAANLTYTAGESMTRLDASQVRLIRDNEPTLVNDLSVQWQPPQSEAGTPDWLLALKGHHLDIRQAGDLLSSSLGNRQPSLQHDIQTARAGGHLLNWQMTFKRQEGQPLFSLVGDLDQLTVSPVRSLPGLGPVSGRINIVESVGEFTLAGDALHLPWPALNAEPFSLESFKAAVGVDLRDPRRLLFKSDTRLSDRGMALSSRLKAIVVPGESPHLDVQSSFSVSDVTQVKHWLPGRLVSAGFRRWVDTALQGGSLHNGSLLFFGQLSDFPFTEGDGVFSIKSDVADGRVLFLEQWPEARAINGHMELNGLTLDAWAGPSRMASFSSSQTSLHIDNILMPVLELQGTSKGNLQQAVKFANTGPLKSILSPVLIDVSGTGDLEMDLALNVPLHDAPVSVESTSTALSRFAVKGSVFLSGNTIAFARSDITLSQVRGAVGFNENGIRVNNLKAIAFDRPIVIDGATQGVASNAVTRVNVSGAIKGSDVLAHYGNPLDQFLRGASQWQVEIAASHSEKILAEQGVQLSISSDLVGTEIRLPVPLNKASGTPSRIDITTSIKEDDDTLSWDIRLDDEVHTVARVVSGTLDSLLVSLGEGTLAPAVIAAAETGIHIRGSVGKVAVDQWTDSIVALIDSFPDTGEPLEPIMPMSVQLAMASFELGTHSLGTATVQVNSDGQFLNATVENRYLEGSVQYPRAYWSKDKPLTARIARFDLAVVDALNSRPEEPEFGPSTGNMDPRFLPPVEVRFLQITGKNNLNIRDVVVRGEPEISGMRFTTIGFAYQNMQLVGQGFWRMRDPQGVNPALSDEQLTRLDLVLQADDFGTGLTHIGLDEVLSDGEGTIELKLSWPGPAYRPDLAQMDGEIKLMIERGNIIPLEPGAGRIVGLFALQALPRRLELDFKDISADGLAFTRITGQGTLNDGVVGVDLVQLTGPIGVIDVSGETDLNTLSFDQKITVLPRVSAALPIIGFISGGASGGVGVLVAAGILKALGIDFDRLGLRNFSLTGTWEQPVFEPVKTSYRRDR